MEDYKEKFQKLFQETTKAIHILLDVQREYKEVYISSVEDRLRGEDSQNQK